jgi:predicted Zn finger-like uncharacterized protein
MKIKCPKCSFAGTIPDEKIPQGGRSVACPKCRASFFVEKEPLPLSPTPRPVPAGQPEGAGIPQPQKRKSGTPKLLPIILVGFSCLIIGYCAGFLVHSGSSETAGDPATPPSLTGSPKSPAGGPPGPRTPEPGTSSASYEIGDLLGKLRTLSSIQIQNSYIDNPCVVYGAGTLTEIDEPWGYLADKTSGNYVLTVEPQELIYISIGVSMERDEILKYNIGSTVSFRGVLTKYDNAGPGAFMVLDKGIVE